jgi:hypothetical protein
VEGVPADDKIPVKAKTHQTPVAKTTQASGCRNRRCSVPIGIRAIQSLSLAPYTLVPTKPRARAAAPRPEGSAGVRFASALPIICW